MLMIIGDHPPRDGKNYDCQCARCGSSVEWIACDVCAGDGVNGHDCGEDCCPCLEPEENVPCDTCRGAGGWRICMSSTAWCESNPVPGREGIDRGVIEWFECAEADHER